MQSMLGRPGLFNALVLDWMSPKCHTLMKPPSGSGVGDSRDALPCDSFAGNLSNRAGVAMAAFGSFVDLLTEIEDPRRAEGKLYRLPHVVLFAILAIVAGANSYRTIHSFIDVHLARLRDAFGVKWRKSRLHDDPWHLATTRSRLGRSCIPPPCRRIARRDERRRSASCGDRW